MSKRITIFIFTCFFSFLCNGAESNVAEIKSFLVGKLPTKLRSLRPGKTKYSEMKKIMGAPDKKNNSLHLYKLSYKKYDTTISIENNIVAYLIFQFKPGTLTLEDLKKWVSKKDIDKAIYDEDKLHHSAGRDFEIDIKDIKIVVSNNSEKRIKSVTFFGDN